MTYHARCKRVAVLREWTYGTPISEIESSFTVNPFYNIGAGALLHEKRAVVLAPSVIGLCFFVYRIGLGFCQMQ